MKTMLIASALFAMLLAGETSFAANGIAPDGSVTAGSCSDKFRSGDCRDGRNDRRRRPVDCHRDVRTHRIGGVNVRHMHIGDNCAVRKVNKGNSF